MNLKWIKHFQLLILDEVDSTNSEAKRIAAAEKSPSSLVVWSHSQTEGRGRHGRKWESLQGNLFISIMLPRTGMLKYMAQLSFVASLSVSNAISYLAEKYNISLDIEHKWPNDVLVNKKKISGILIESGGLNNEYIVVGIGVNVKEFPSFLSKTTTSLKDNGLYFTEPHEVLCCVMTFFEKHYREWLVNDFLKIRDEWIKKASQLNDIITVATSHSRISGKFVDIDFSGAIRLQVASGEILSVHAGEVFFHAG